MVRCSLIRDPDGMLSLDVRILSEDASVQDYLDAMHLFQGKHVAPCDGCTNCCWERAPLSAPDVLRFAAAPDAAAGFSPADPWLLFLRDYTTTEALSTDVCLKRTPEGSCVFLDTDKGRCRAYPQRPLVCQTYVCLPSAPRAQALRGRIVNEGENELARLLGEAAAALPDGMAPLPAAAAGAWRNCRSRGFAGKKTFADVLIREVVKEGLWSMLTEGGP